MMKFSKLASHSLLSLIAATALTLIPTASTAGNLGLGVIVGEPTGLSGKLFLDKTHAIDFAAAWSFEGNDSLQLHADYLFHKGQVPINADTHGSLPWYWGVGVRLKFQDNENNNSRNNNDDLIGIRVPVGLAWYPENTKLEVFGELTPTLDVAPDTDFDLGLGIGARYYF